MYSKLSWAPVGNQFWTTTQGQDKIKWRSYCGAVCGSKSNELPSTKCSYVLVVHWHRKLHYRFDCDRVLFESAVEKLSSRALAFKLSFDILFGQYGLWSSERMAEEGFFGSVIEVDNLHNVESGFIGFRLPCLRWWVRATSALACRNDTTRLAFKHSWLEAWGRGREEIPLSVHDIGGGGAGGREGGMRIS